MSDVRKDNDFKPPAKVEGDWRTPLQSGNNDIVKVMTNERVIAIIQETLQRVLELRRTKGMEYTGGSDDALYNFRNNAVACGASLELIWRIYAGKHWDAISTYVKDIVLEKTRERSEPIVGRVDDLITYLLLFKAILEERGDK